LTECQRKGIRFTQLTLDKTTIELKVRPACQIQSNFVLASASSMEPSIAVEWGWVWNLMQHGCCIRAYMDVFTASSRPNPTPPLLAFRTTKPVLHLAYFLLRHINRLVRVLLAPPPLLFVHCAYSAQ